ncbi:S8 family serine peptidase [Hanstruepera ponticola]|uniref:S8 family serine peptidase n=1 Tax=Hanstruepera ponticola TaxID=2042995 RepID=UPI000CF194F0|nr:S8 family serine peptidase [Hanstruepera ponticola]
MKKLVLVITLLTLTTVSIFAQSNYYYYYKGGKVFLNLDKSSLYINTDNTFLKSSVDNQNLLDYNLKTESSPINGEINKWSIIDFATIPTDIEYYQKINTIKSVSTVNVVAPSFTTMTGKRIVLSRHFFVKLKQASDLNLLQQKASENNILIKGQNPFMPLWYTLVCTKHTLENSLDIANQFHESNFFETAIPNFISRQNQLNLDAAEEPSNSASTCVNDSYFGNQWNLENTGQVVSTNPTINAVAGIDINACDAWTLTTGNSSINIAVLDSGVDLNHPDLINAINDTSPSIFDWFHGTACAGIIGATQNNTIGVSGISPDCKVMSIYISLFDQESIANGVNWAWENGADVLNNSWKTFTQSDLVDEAYENALTQGRNGKGSIIVFSSGNNEGLITEYPANLDERFIVVGAISPCGERANPNSCDQQDSWGSAYGIELDVIAPGVFIPTTDISGTDGLDNGDYILTFNATSSAAPHVTAIAGLILSVNPCLTNIEVNNIIESTAQKVNENAPYSYQNHPERPNGTWNNEMGYGLVDAHAAVVMAQSMYSTDLDLYVKDSPDDDGSEPNSVTQNMWTSQDIWVRNVNDDGLTHQNPEYKSNNEPNFINVRVINKSCVASTGSETLAINWAKANTSLAWPENWDGTLTNSGNYSLGGALPEVSIPVIQAGSEAIVKIPWVVPDPENYTDNPNPWHFCLLAKINATDDPLASPMTSNPNYMVRNNNNLAWKNLTVVDLETETTSAIVMVSNPLNIPKTYYFELHKEINEGGKAIFDEAEVTLKMDDVLFNAWERGGKKSQLLDDKPDEKVKLVKGDNVVLDDILFEPNEMGLLTLKFNFLTEELTDKTKYTYHIIQKEKSTDEIIGGETFVIKKIPRPLFLANAGDNLAINQNETITLSAEQINEAAVYNWYDMEGNLIYQGKDLTVSSDVTKKYRF